MLKLLGKVDVVVLALMLAALPVAACMLPGAAMTTAERDCCKKMAGECGHAGMAQSHSCCHSNGSPDTRPLVKVASSAIPHFTLAVMNVISQAEILASTHAFLSPWTMQVHSPPAETPPDTTVLRI